LKAISGKNLCKILEGKNWNLKRINGSHHIYVKSRINTRISVPVHKNQSLKLGLQRHIMKIANIDENEL
jgi:predicted RNA binding protein YcfA (HicA-like mRNA interferase family)